MSRKLGAIHCFNAGINADKIFTESCQLALQNKYRNANGGVSRRITSPEMLQVCTIAKDLANRQRAIIWDNHVDDFNDENSLSFVKDIGAFESFTQKVTGDTTATYLNLVKATIVVSDTFMFPVYFLGSNEEVNNKDALKSNSTDTDGGNLNLQISYARMVKNDLPWLCYNAKNLVGGCYFGGDAGFKYTNIADSIDSSDSGVSWYLSSFIEIDFAVYAEGMFNNKEFNRSGLGKIGLQAAWTQNNAEMAEFLLNENIPNPNDQNRINIGSDMFFAKLYASVNIDNYLVGRFTWVPWASDSNLKGARTFIMDYQALEF